MRAEARAAALPVAAKPDSHEICFVPGNDYTRFIEAYYAERGEPMPAVAGAVRDRDGRVLARHGGVHGFTIGQRKGLGVAAGRPLYVLHLEPATGAVTVGEDADLFRASATVSGVNWVSLAAPYEPVRAEVQIRYRHRAAPATLVPAADGRVRLEFDQPQRAITPGQAAVFYRGDLVLGGGWLDRD